MQITRWVACEIVKSTAIKLRIKKICHFILVCEFLLMLHNFNGLMTIFAGLSQFAITRLKTTWTSLPSEYIYKWRDLEEFMKPLGGFNNLRQMQLNSELPSVPCLSLLFHDLIQIEDGNEEYIDENKKFLNFEKALMQGRLFIHIKKTQKAKYNLQHVDFIQQYFRNLETNISEEQIIDLSRVLEPGN